LHRAKGVFQIVMRGRQHPRRGAGVIRQIAFVETLCHAAVRKKIRSSLVVRGDETGVV
jgi:hypothetical protein